MTRTEDGGFLRRLRRKVGPVYRLARNRVWAARVNRENRHGPEVWFWPDRPAPETMIFKSLRRSGLRIRKGRPGAGPLFVWRDATYVDVPSDLQSRAATTVNARCCDISKSRVDEVHREVFGYGLAVDPTSTEGPIVAKSELNSTHDGRVLRGPIAELESDVVYMAVVDNAVGDLVEDLRAVVVGDKVPIACLYRRPLRTRFGNLHSSVVAVPSDEVFSPCEQKQLLELSRELGLDYGELDVLRDNSDGRIHVVDANKTPWCPSSGITTQEADRLVGLVAEAVQEAFLSSR